MNAEARNGIHNLNLIIDRRPQRARPRLFGGLGTALLVLLFLPPVLHGQVIVRQESFENPNTVYDDWYTDSGIWEIGKPTSGPGAAYRGTNCAATLLAGNYGNNVDSRLIWDPLQPLVVPPADQQPRLRFLSWMDSFAADYGRVLIKTNGGAWVNLSGNIAGPGQAWQQAVLDLSAYANQTVQLAFLFHSDGDGAIGAGWYVDEVTLVAGPIVPFVPNGVESFETGWGDWTVEGGGPWELGRPTSGPGSAHAGTNCVATRVAGNYVEQRFGAGVFTNRLVSPAFVVPAAGASPRLRFWHWYSMSAGPDYGEVQIKVGAGAWQVLGHYEGNSSGAWTRPSFDLSAYAGQSVRLGFFFSWRNELADY